MHRVIGIGTDPDQSNNTEVPIQLVAMVDISKPSSSVRARQTKLVDGKMKSYTAVHQTLSYPIFSYPSNQPYASSYNHHDDLASIGMDNFV